MAKPLAFVRMRKKFVINLRDGRSIVLGDRTVVVGVLNVTPDSFSDGGLHFDVVQAVDRALELEAEGADVVEIGGESTRPGSVRVSVEQELSRVLPVLRKLKGLRVPIAIDTYKSQVAAEAIALGASIVNDISALRFDPSLASVVARERAALVLMHMRGEPATMQRMDPSPEIFSEITSDLNKAISLAESQGVRRDMLVVDPGIGFGKTLEQNLAILNHLERFEKLNLPLMIGTSRKSFIGRITGRTETERAFGSAASIAIAILRGAHLLRVHDVKEMVDVIRVADAIVMA
ncbi:MAG TPA: dihydropteroate synthase [Blastocatellia bacterium]|nr:dihydropteroate synthase [Blastocatellia bacterium]